MNEKVRFDYICLLLKKSGLVSRYQAEGFANAVFIHEKTRTADLNKEKTYETLMGYMPNYIEIRLFGRDSYLHTPKSINASKLAHNAEVDLYIGTKKWIILDLVRKEDRVTTTKHATFNETCYPVFTTTKYETCVEINDRVPSSNSLHYQNVP